MQYRYPAETINRGLTYWQAEGMQALGLGDYKKAADCYDKAVIVDPTQATLRHVVRQYNHAGYSHTVEANTYSYLARERGRSEGLGVGTPNFEYGLNYLKKKHKHFVKDQQHAAPTATCPSPNQTVPTAGGGITSQPAQGGYHKGAPERVPLAAATPPALAPPASTLIAQGDCVTADVPEHFTDPITFEVMRDPVFCSDGYTYDRDTAQALDKSPVTRLPLTILGPNIGLRSLIWDARPDVRGFFTPPPEHTYTGEQNEQAIAHGQGRRDYANGMVEKGLFAEGALVLGARVHANGNAEKGAFVDGKLQGRGVRVYGIGHKAGQNRVGHFEQGDLQHGYISYPNGDRYNGHLEAGERSGHGKIYFLDGGHYVGAWDGDRMHGHGIRTWSNGVEYIGEFADGLRHGSGVQTWPRNDGNIQGAINGERCWEATNAWLRGVVYVGSFAYGKCHGHGVQTWPRGEKYVGEHERDAMHGQGTFSWPDGQHYTGSFQADKRHGQGTLIWASGARYTGFFANSKLEGQGLLTWPNGAVFEGSFIDGKRAQSTSARTTPKGYVLPLPKYSVSSIA